jgi:nucleotide-binding universal stress UspA family protein
MGVIVVGVDGSESSNAALTWAHAEARVRGSKLLLVHAWHPSAFEYGAMGVAAYEPHEDVLREAEAHTYLERTAAAVLGPEPGIDRELRVLKASPAHALRDAAVGADLLVVGSRGHGGFAELLLGSVSHYLVHHAPCPVVVIRGRMDVEALVPPPELEHAA